METLLNWAESEVGRHFIVKMGNTYHETRWRVCVWSKREGETINQGPGEGYGSTSEEATEAALKNWAEQTVLPRKTGLSWYVPGNVAERIEGEP